MTRSARAGASDASGWRFNICAALYLKHIANKGNIVNRQDQVRQTFMTVIEAAKIMGVSGRRVRQLLKEGQVKGVQLNPRMWLVDRKSAENFAKLEPPHIGRPRKSSCQS